MNQRKAIRVRPMRPTVDDLKRLQALFAKNGTERSLAAFEWQYLRNPTGKIYVDFAEDEESGALAGVYATLPVEFRVGEETSLALQSLDTLTDEAYRGQGLFLRLARSVFARAASDGAALVYGFPNANSAHGFFSRLAWVSLDPVPFLVRPLRTGYVTGRLPVVRRLRLPDLPVPVPAPALDVGQEIRVLSRFDDEIGSLWRSSLAAETVGVERNARYLNWRFIDKPGERYLSHAFYEQGRAQGFCVSALKEKHGGKVVYVLELVHAPGRTDVGAALLSTALRCAALAQADIALAWCLPHSTARAAFRRLAFLPLPEKLRPIALHVGVAAFRALACPVGNRRHWYLSYADSDTV